MTARYWKLTDKDGNELPLPVKTGRWAKKILIEFDSGTAAMKAFHSLAADMGYPNPEERLPPLASLPRINRKGKDE
jgi:hypothetical protein